VFGYTPLSFLLVLGCTLLAVLPLANDWEAAILVAAFYGGTSVLWLLYIHGIVLYVRIRYRTRPDSSV